ncbi:MAG TPA: creatininase family protein [Dehalococcoidales bacterium]
MRYGDLTYQEIQERAFNGWLAIVPTGCTEQQGPHLPVDFDTWFSEQVCLAAAQKVAIDCNIHSLVIPPMPFGPTPEHRNYGSGYIDINKELHELLIASILNSLADQGFRRIIIWRGCGQHDFRDTVNRFNSNSKNKTKVYLPTLPYHDIWCRIADPSVPGGHADSFTTSIALFLRPDTVRREKLFNPYNKEVDWADPELDFSSYSSSGVIGDPTHSSSELGARLWAAVVQEVSMIFRAVAEGQVNRWLG